jgi:acetyl esterase/lipase
MPESSKLQIRCGGCQTLLKVSSEAIGKTIACPKCGKQMKLTKPSSAPPKEEIIDVGFPEANQAELFDLPATSYSMPTSASKSLAGSKKRSTPWPLIIGIAAAGGVLLFLASVGVIFLMMIPKGPNVIPAVPEKNPPTSTASSPSTTALAPSLAQAMPKIRVDFPQLGQFQSFGKSGIVWQRVEIPRRQQSPLKLNIFVPSGNHAAKSLPVVFEAPSGTPLIHGASIEMPQPDTEFLPFTEAGMITVSFDIDGPMPSNVNPANPRPFLSALSKAYTGFVGSDAGVDNGKMAIDFVLEKLPMADPSRFIVWGHSSAASLALLLASKDNRVSKCIAMAPETDLNQRLGDIISQEPAMADVLPNFKNYLVSGSPITYVSRLKCPVFLAHAKNDDNVPFESAKKYVDALRKAGGKISFLELEKEGHYQPLLDTAIPKAIEWLK